MLKLINEGWTGVAFTEESRTVGEDGIVKRVCLCGNLSKNGYPIPSSSFGDAEKVKRLYENRHVYSNHLENPTLQKVRTRPVEQLCGYVRNVRMENGKPYGDVHTDGCPNGEMFRSLAKANVPDVGMSHVANYKWKNREFSMSKREVESVEEVYTVDLVTSPATTSGFTENSHGDDDSMDLEQALKELDTVRKERDELKGKLTSAEADATKYKTSATEADARVATLKSENDTLSGKVKTFEAKHAKIELKATVEAELKAAKLNIADADVCSPFFIESLCAETDSAKRAIAIADRVKVTAKMVSNDPTGGNREHVEDTNEKKFDVESVLKRTDLFIE